MATKSIQPMAHILADIVSGIADIDEHDWRFVSAKARATLTLPAERDA